jgi:predicted nucleotidyltransferase
LLNGAGACHEESHVSEPWKFMPTPASNVYKEEIKAGRGPVSLKQCEPAITSRLRMYNDYDNLAGASEGLDYRLRKYISKESTIDAILTKTKTKRYVMSRLRRMLVNASLNITIDDTKNPPPYIRVLAMNETGKMILKDMRKKSTLPIITKPASVYKLDASAVEMFHKEAAATDLYVLAYSNENERIGGREWFQSPIVI